MKRVALLLYLTLVFLSLGISCKAVLKAKRLGTDREVAIIPQLIDQTKQNAIDMGMVDVEVNGRLKPKLVLPLDFFPQDQQAVGVLPHCLKPLNADFEVGTAVCIQGKQSQIPIKAKHLMQECYTNAQASKAQVLEPLAFINCDKVKIYVHKFSPELRIDVEMR